MRYGWCVAIGAAAGSETVRLFRTVDGGLTWKSAVKDWTISRRGDEPSDFWSQSFCWGSLWVADGTASPVRVRFRNSGGRSYARAEAHLVYRTTGRDETKVTFSWTDDRGSHQTSHVFAQAAEHDEGTGSWTVPTDRGVQTRWVEFEAVR